MSNINTTHTVTLQHSDGTSTTPVRCQIVPVKAETMMATGGHAITTALFDTPTDLRDGDVILVLSQDNAVGVGSFARYNVQSWQPISVIPSIKAIVEGTRL